jgi:prepilin-type processing-associated H-X9-DG protein
VTDLPNAFNTALFWYHIVAGNYGGSKVVRQGKFSPKVLRCPADNTPKKLSEVTADLGTGWQENHQDWLISYGWAHTAGFAQGKKSHEIVADQQMFKIGRTKYKPTISVIASDRTQGSVGDYVMKFEYAVSISTLSRTDNYYNQFPVRHSNKDNFLMLDGHVRTAYHKKMNMDGFKRITQK